MRTRMIKFKPVENNDFVHRKARKFWFHGKQILELHTFQQCLVVVSDDTILGEEASEQEEFSWFVH